MSELRVNRLAEQIKKEITYVLATKVKNHDLGFVTVTEVALTGDYSQAKVFYTVLGGEREKEKTKEAFKKLLDNEDMEIIIDYGEIEENSNFTIAMHEKLFFVDKMFYACCNFNGEIDEYYMG